MKVNELLDTARAEIGYIGKKSNKDLYDPTANVIGLYTKYAEDLYKAGYYNFNKNGYDYCCVFADWVFWKTVGESKEEAIKVKPYNLYNAGITWAHKAFADIGRTSKFPQAGACIFFLDSKKELCHIGLVEEVGDTTITTIEGNVSKKVVRKTYNINDPVIYDYGLPFYEEEPQPQPTEDWTTLAEWKDLDGKSLRIQKHN